MQTFSWLKNLVLILTFALLSMAAVATLNEATVGRKDNRGVTVNHGSIDRITFVVRQDGKVAAIIGDLKPAENVDDALRQIGKLAANKFHLVKANPFLLNNSFINICPKYPL